MPVFAEDPFGGKKRGEEEEDAGGHAGGKFPLPGVDLATDERLEAVLHNGRTDEGAVEAVRLVPVGEALKQHLVQVDLFGFEGGFADGEGLLGVAEMVFLDASRELGAVFAGTRGLELVDITRGGCIVGHAEAGEYILGTGNGDVEVGLVGGEAVLVADVGGNVDLFAGVVVVLVEGDGDARLDGTLLGLAAGEPADELTPEADVGTVLAGEGGGAALARSRTSPGCAGT